MEIKFVRETKKSPVVINIPVDVVHYVDEEKGVVTAVARLNGDEAFIVAERTIDWIDPHFLLECIVNMDSRLHADITMPATMRAVARCHEEDTFDMWEGVSIADDKLVMKLQTSILKRVNLFKRALIDTVEKLDSLEGV